MDKILLEGIQLLVRVGTTDEERNTPQFCAIDVVFGAQLEKAGQSGNLADTVNYAELFRQIEQLMAERTFTLLEEIGHEILELALQLTGVRWVRVRVRKLQPFSDKVQSVGIEMKRRLKGSGEEKDKKKLEV
jgi:dihydroneopterin aldolase